ncbi:MAG: hypothetical protein BYD32DRAFT_206523 [Podila humilis]|nr:MAG: hypothetical protein BYD32DRAFT_206523 [Podila humilis]
MCMCVCVCITSSILGELSFSCAVLYLLVLLCVLLFISFPTFFHLASLCLSFSSLSSFLFSLLSKAIPLDFTPTNHTHISRLAFFISHFTFHCFFFILCIYFSRLNQYTSSYLCSTSRLDSSVCTLVALLCCVVYTLHCDTPIQPLSTMALPFR